MTPEELTKIQREFLIRTEKQSAVLLDRELVRVKRKISEKLRKNLSADVSAAAEKFLKEFFAFLNSEVDDLSISAARIVRIGQRRVINNAAESLRKFLPEVKTSIFSPDREAIQNLIGRTQTGKSLVKFFQKFKPVVAENAKQALIEGFKHGESSQAIASRLHIVTDAERHRVLTISRTETNEAYRAASREFYASADIKQYVWLAVLDPRTCAVCWHLHGQRFKSAKKIFSHPNCRCVLVPWTKNQKRILTGAEHFARLETGYQKQILGGKKFEIYKAGKSFDEFFSSRVDIEYGQRFFVKNLSDLAGGN